jgi:hypothetical protein
MNRSEAIKRTRRLVDEGERLQVAPSLPALRTWLQISDEHLSSTWGSMDRYHLVWLGVGRSDAIRGRPMTPDEESAYVRDVANQKTAALRMSLDAVERQGMPFVGETGGVGHGPPAKPELPQDPSLAERLADARRQAEEHLDHDAPRAPRPDRMQR